MHRPFFYKIRTMDLIKTIADLRAQREKLEAVIKQLEAVEGGVVKPRSPRGSKSMGEAERRVVSARMSYQSPPGTPRRIWTASRAEEHHLQGRVGTRAPPRPSRIHNELPPNQALRGLLAALDRAGGLFVPQPAPGAGLPYSTRDLQ